MKSMTGFGRSSNRDSSQASDRMAATKSVTARASASLKKGAQKASRKSAPESEVVPIANLDISIKAVNGRYLDIRFHAPREYAALESEFKTIIAALFKRGTLDVYVNRARGSAAAQVRVNADLARKWLEGYEALGKALKIRQKPSLALIAERVPEVFEVNSHDELGEEEREVAKKLLSEAAHACDQERKREGRALQSELTRLCDRLSAIGTEIESLKDSAKAELERRLSARLDEQMQRLGLSGKVDEQRLAQEIVISIDRSDIGEEIIRLREHLKAYSDLLKSEEPQGKKLDFYAQELLREVNTIGSKSHISALTSLVVEAKTLVERIREQVQNVE